MAHVGAECPHQNVWRKSEPENTSSRVQEIVLTVWCPACFAPHSLLSFVSHKRQHQLLRPTSTPSVVRLTRQLTPSRPHRSSQAETTLHSIKEPSPSPLLTSCSIGEHTILPRRCLERESCGRSMNTLFPSSVSQQ